MEYQLHPKREDLSRWFTKCGGLTYQLGCKTALFVLYLTKGDNVVFPDVYETSISGISNTFRFQTLRIWEHAEEIERGDFPELAPLLILCMTNPTLDTVRRQIEIISESELEANVRKSLFSMIMSMASRAFSRNLLKTLFQKEIDMGLYETVYDDWIREAEKRAEDRGEAKGEARGEARGEAKGEARGEEKAARRHCLQVLELRLGVLPEELIVIVNNSSREKCEALMATAFKIESFSELDWRL